MESSNQFLIEELNGSESSFCKYLSKLPLKDRIFELINLIQRELAKDLNLEQNEVGLDAPFSSLNTKWKNLEIVYRLLRRIVETKLERTFFSYELFPYPREQGPRDTIKKVATYLASEMVIPPPKTTFTDPHEGGIFAWKLSPPLSKTAKRNPPAVFILSPPRSGSTLLRMMLDGHPALCSPPELHLLPFERMGERGRQLDQLGYPWLRVGLKETLAQLERLTPEQAQRRTEQLEADDVAIQKVYRLLQDLIEGRLLVDKSPSYAMCPAWLLRAEHMFEGAKYLHLIRHPYAVIESFVRMRFHGHLIGNHFGTWDDNPWLYAEKGWAVAHRNTLKFFQDIDPNRHCQVYFEDLVSQPGSVMKQVCDFLNVPFDDRVLAPNESEPLTEPGDAYLRSRGRIDPLLATAWKGRHPPQQPSELTQQIAADLGYDLRGMP